MQLKAPINDNFESYIDKIFTDCFLKYLCNQVNKIINRDSTTREYSSHSRIIKNFIQITFQDIKNYIAIIIYMGICVLPKIKMYWDKPEVSNFKQSFEGKIMSYKKSTLINTNLSLNNIQKAPKI